MTIEHEVRALQTIPMFSAVQPSRLKLLAFASERVAYGPDEIVFRQGDTSESALVVLAGTARVTLSLPAGRSIDVATVGVNAFVGEMGVIRDAPRSATIVAASELIVLRISRDIFLSMLREFPSIALAVMRDLADRLDQTNARLATLRRE